MSIEGKYQKLKEKCNGFKKYCAVSCYSCDLSPEKYICQIEHELEPNSFTKDKQTMFLCPFCKTEIDRVLCTVTYNTEYTYESGCLSFVFSNKRENTRKLECQNCGHIEDSLMPFRQLNKEPILDME
jgi:hypothetical protein